MLVTLSPQSTFREAADIWLESRRFGKIKSRARYLCESTLKGYVVCIRALDRFFSDAVTGECVKLRDIHLGHIDEYRKFRLSVAGPNKIKQEEDLLIAILKRAGCWTPEMDEHYERLQRVENDIPQALVPEQQEHWLHIAQSQERWFVIYWYSVVAFRTTATHCEMRGLRLQDVNLYNQVMTIQSRHAKNSRRIRTVPLPPDALHCAERLMDRARALGSIMPEHYLFPFRVNATQRYIPSRPMSEWGLRSLWEEVRDAAQLPHPFTFHDCRHTAITRMAEAGIPMPIILDIAGHVSLRMQRHYTQISMQAKKRAQMAVYSRTIYDTQEPLFQRRQ